MNEKPATVIRGNQIQDVLVGPSTSVAGARSKLSRPDNLNGGILRVEHCLLEALS